MEFEQFAPARDFFYLCALFLGAGFGCIINRFRRASSARFRNGTVTVGLCFFSGAAMALTAAVIYSNWMILKEAVLYLPIVISVVVVILAFRFPRAAGFPLFIIAGVLTVAAGYICLSFPVIDKSDRVWINREGNGLVLIRPVTESASSISFQIAGEGAVLEFQACCFSFSKIFPLVGGVNRGIVTQIRGNNEPLYTNPDSLWKILSGSDPEPGTEKKGRNFPGIFFSFLEIKKTMEITELPPGTGLTVFFNGPALVFR